jgi:hypothetical protein
MQPAPPAPQTCPTGGPPPSRDHPLVPCPGRRRRCLRQLEVLEHIDQQLDERGRRRPVDSGLHDGKLVLGLRLGRRLQPAAGLIEPGGHGRLDAEALGAGAQGAAGSADERLSVHRPDLRRDRQPRAGDHAQRRREPASEPGRRRTRDDRRAQPRGPLHRLQDLHLPRRDRLPRRRQALLVADLKSLSAASGLDFSQLLDQAIPLGKSPKVIALRAMTRRPSCRTPSAARVAPARS